MSRLGYANQLIFLINTYKLLLSYLEAIHNFPTNCRKLKSLPIRRVNHWGGYKSPIEYRKELGLL